MTLAFTVVVLIINVIAVSHYGFKVLGVHPIAQWGSTANPKHPVSD